MAETLAALILAALILYALLAGADFGGGVWDLLASGPRAKAQRALVDQAIAPIWEANHVWLILVVVLLFTAFPAAFSALSTALHIPLTLVLLGIVFRGSAYVFRKYGEHGDSAQERWGQVFAVSSILTPFFLGTVIGTVTSGTLSIREGMPREPFLFAWLEPFPLSVGFFTLALFAFLAAVYLTREGELPELQDDFRRRAICAEIAVLVLALSCALLAGPGTRTFADRLLRSWWSSPLLFVTSLSALGTSITLWARKYRLARVCAASEVTLILLGWGAAHYPYLIAPDLTVQNAAAPAVTLRLLYPVLAVGALLIFPSLYWMLRVFRKI